MLLSLAQWLQTLSPEFGFFRVFQYITFRAVMETMTALLIGIPFGPWALVHLPVLQVCQPLPTNVVHTRLLQTREPHTGGGQSRTRLPAYSCG